MRSCLEAHDRSLSIVMKRPLQVYLDDAELQRLSAWARARGWTMSEAVRAAVGALLRARDADDVMALSGMVQGLPRDLSENIDTALTESFVAEGAPRYGRRAGRTVRR